MRFDGGTSSPGGTGVVGVVEGVGVPGGTVGGFVGGVVGGTVGGVLGGGVCGSGFVTITESYVNSQLFGSPTSGSMTSIGRDWR